jgi:DNA polymerase I-like protein with 3'-5' exonuclease and polymerase domains
VRKTKAGRCVETLPLFVPVSNWVAPALSSLPSWEGQARVGFDTEFHDPTLNLLGLGARRGVKIAGYSFAFNDGTKHYVPLRHPEGNVDCEQGMRYLREQAKNFKGELVGANLPTEIDTIAYDPTGPVVFSQVSAFRDVLVADPLIYELHKDGYSLEVVSKRRGCPGKNEDMLREAAASYGADMSKARAWKAVIPKMPARYVGEYAEDDAWLPLRVLEVQDKVIDTLGIRRAWDLESALLPVLIRMRQRGVRLDFDQLDRIDVEARREEAQALDKIRQLTGVTIPCGKTMTAVLCVPAFAAVGIQVPMTRHPKTGKLQYSIDKEFLNSLNHPVSQLLAHARKYGRRYRTIKKLMVHVINGRIHSTLKQVVGSNDRDEKDGAAFGRLSSVKPNMQQQPNDNEWRKIYIPEEGAMWGCLDYCFSNDTEILTRDRGFVLFKDLVEGEAVAQYDKGTAEITYAAPLGYQRFHYTGEMIHIHSMKSVDMLVTPNHECLLYTEKGKPEIVKADQYPCKWTRRQVWAGNLKDCANAVTDEQLITSVAVQADGTLRTGNYRIWVSRERKVERCLKYVTHTNTYTCVKKGNQTAFIVPLDATPLLEPGSEKNFNRSAVMGLSHEQRHLFIRELLNWDGSGELKKAGLSVYSTTNAHNATVVQEVATVTGLKGQLSHTDPPGGRKRLYYVHLSYKDRTTTETMKVEPTQYDAAVYCVTMPLGTVIVRRNGKVAVTAQCAQEPRWTTHHAARLGLPGADKAAAEYRTNIRTDPHSMTAAMTGLARKSGKIMFLARCYGEGNAKMAVQLGLPTRWALRMVESGEMAYFETRYAAAKARKEYCGDASYFETAGEEAQLIIDQFDNNLPFVRQLAKRAEERARKTGTIELLYGRLLNFETDKQGRYDFVYKALNRKIQGDSGYQSKAAIVAIDREMPHLFLNGQGHDEIDGSFGSFKEMKQAAEIMEQASGPTLVPWRIDIEHGNSWGNMVLMCAHRECFDIVDKSQDTTYCPRHKHL